MPRKFILSILILLIPILGKAQCAMCKAVTESSDAAGATTSTGINEGIIYLMAFPYIIMAAVGIIFYRYRKSKLAEVG